jgi:simple sugar transport system substrate-binding protein
MISAIKRRAAVAIATAATLALTMSACSGRGEETPETTAAPTTLEGLAIVTPETESDHGWNQAGLVGAALAAEQSGLELTVNDNVGYDDMETILTQTSEGEGVGLVIAHASGYAAAAARVAASTGVPILIGGYEEDQVEGQVGVITIDAAPGGYLAGVVAAESTTSNVLGIALSADDPNWFAMSSGFIAGARSVNPDVTINLATVGPAAYADSAGGKTTVQQLIATGADVIFGMGDGATVGYIAAVEESATPVKYIADIGDVTDLFSDPSLLLTSVLWNFDGVYADAIAALEDGSFGSTTFPVDLPGGGISLQETDQLTGDIPAALEAAEKGILDGSIVVKAAGSKDELNALLAE